MKTPFEELRELIHHPKMIPNHAAITIPLELAQRLSSNPPEGARHKSIEFLEKILTDIRDNKTLAYLVVRMEGDGSSTFTNGFDGKLSKQMLKRFETACIYCVTQIQAKIQKIKRGN